MRFAFRALPGVDSRLALGLCAVAALLSMPFPSAAALLEAGEVRLGPGESAQFALAESGGGDLRASCTLAEADGPVTLLFDAEGYIPLSDPFVGQRVTLKAGEVRTFDLTGAVTPTGRTPFIAFFFETVPSAFCFPGQSCGGAAEGASAVTVRCGPT